MHQVSGTERPSCHEASKVILVFDGHHDPLFYVIEWLWHFISVLVSSREEMTQTGFDRKRCPVTVLWFWNYWKNWGRSRLVYKAVAYNHATELDTSTKPVPPPARCSQLNTELHGRWHWIHCMLLTLWSCRRVTLVSHPALDNRKLITGPLCLHTPHICLRRYPKLSLLLKITFHWWF